MYVISDANGRIVGSSDSGLVGATEVATPDGWDTEHQHDWRMEDGVLEHDPLPEPEEAETETERLKAENVLLRAQAQALSDRGEFVEDCIAEMATQVYGGA